jgi:1,4-alpha-glucan branching enzyme
LIHPLTRPPAGFIHLALRRYTADSGGNRGNLGGVNTEAKAWHGQPQSALIALPPLSAVYLRKAN